MDEMTFENAMEKLEGIVANLENGGTTLDESIKLFEEGTKLSSFCYDKLKKAEQTLEK